MSSKLLMLKPAQASAIHLLALAEYSQVVCMLLLKLDTFSPLGLEVRLSSGLRAIQLLVSVPPSKDIMKDLLFPS